MALLFDLRMPTVHNSVGSSDSDCQCSVANFSIQQEGEAVLKKGFWTFILGCKCQVHFIFNAVSCTLLNSL